MLHFDHYFFSFLTIVFPVLIYFSFSYHKEIYKKNSYTFGFICIISIILCMTFPIELTSSHIFDLRTIPWLLAFLYGGLPSGILVTIVMFIYRALIGIDQGLIFTIIVYMLTIIPLSFVLSKYRKYSFWRKMSTSTIITMINTAILLFFILYASEKFPQENLQAFLIYFILAHLTTIAVIVYLIETLQEKERVKMQLQQTEKMHLIGEMAASVAHEVRNPLTTVKGFLQLLKSEHSTYSDRSNYVDIMNKELEKAETIISDYLALAQPQADEIERVNIKDVAREVTDMLSPYGFIHHTTIMNEIDDSYYIQGNRNQVQQLFMNLIKNAIEATEDQGTVNMKATKMKSEVEIQIIDNGSGMSKSVIQRFGTPFYSTKEKGTGLGTMTSCRIIEHLQGTIDIWSQEGKGTKLSIRIPLAEEKPTS